MSKNNKFAAIAVVCILGVAVTEMIQETKRQRQIRKEIATKLARDLVAINVASVRIQDRIKNGYYRNSGLATIEQDFEFERIIAFNEQ